jgi:hypothetical protein
VNARARPNRRQDGWEPYPSRAGRRPD